jgi:hypothetical protein
LELLTHLTLIAVKVEDLVKRCARVGESLAVDGDYRTVFEE